MTGLSKFKLAAKWTIPRQPKLLRQTRAKVREPQQAQRRIKHRAQPAYLSHDREFHPSPKVGGGEVGGTGGTLSTI